MRGARLLGVAVVTVALARGVAAAPADRSLAGAWRAESGTFAGLVLLARGGRRTFLADRAVLCVTTPCPPRRLVGRWRARNGVLRLRPRGERPLALRYTLAGTTLTLTDRSGTRFIARLARTPAYCVTAEDCTKQDYARPRCVGHDVCEPAQTCRWECGGAPRS